MDQLKKGKFVTYNFIQILYNSMKSRISSIIKKIYKNHPNEMMYKPMLSQHKVLIYALIQKPYFIVIFSFCYSSFLNQSLAFCEDNDYVPELVKNVAWWLLVNERPEYSDTTEYPADYIPQIVKDIAELTVNTSTNGTNEIASSSETSPSIDTKEIGSSSETSPPIDTNYSLVDIVISFKTYLNDDKGIDVIAAKSESFMRNDFPQNLLSTNLADINNPEAPLFKFMAQSVNPLDMNDVATRVAYRCLNVAIRTYHDIRLSNPDYTQEEFNDCYFREMKKEIANK